MISFIVLLIAGFSVAGFCFQLAARSRYKRELMRVDQVEGALAGLEAERSLGDLISQTGLSRSTIVGHRLWQVAEIARSPAPPSVGELSEADRDRDDATLSNSFPNTLISLLLIVGLAGTLLAFSSILSENPVASLGSGGDLQTPKVMEWMKSVYASFSSAFQASLAGIGGTVWLLLTRAFVHNVRDELFDRLDRFAAGQLYPRFVERQATDAATLIYAGQQLIQTAHVFGSTIESLASIPLAVREATEGLSLAAKEMHKTVRAATKSVQAFEQVFAEGGEVRSSLDELASTASSFAKSTKETVAGLRESVGSAAQEMRGSASAVERATAAVATAADRSARAAEHIGQLTSRFGAHGEKQAKAHEQVLGKIGELVKEIVGEQRELAQNLPSAIDQMRQAAEATSGGAGALSTAAGALITAVGTLEKHASESQASAAVQTAHLDEVVRHLGEAVRSLAGQQESLLQQLNPLLSDLPQQLVQQSQRQEQLLGKLADVCAELQDALANRASDIEQSQRPGFGRWLFGSRE